MSGLQLRPVSARSAVLSTLLALHPPRQTAAQLVAGLEHLGFTETATRAALSRMVTRGDLRRDDDASYTLSERLLERQRRVDAVHHPETRPWHGTWEMAIVTTTGRSAADRAALRTHLQSLRVAELREGVWTRPANLRRGWPQELTAISECFESRPLGDPAALAAELWDLDGWAVHGRQLLDALPRTSVPAERFTLVAAMVRHLQSDPLLPAELSPADWPGQELRAAYDEYRALTWG
ncbi:PaaX family transcriptional regulator C-terminal domain-containing protein [Nocardioides sp.]|uniref:PaaX family transcriptional regulator C-terminal domain-containing protein n=1 Tax=Nocardioides sp. TaxID=35761 RepID=UPI002D0C410E|nr:PaaX family transcriptional regulator C-terminal domain-containing protein [Nocardioides sp.]HSX66435.1 PaaX family transcriptional regulator C-terminal domain-containing protein [Nocardioides sp.]